MSNARVTAADLAKASKRHNQRPEAQLTKTVVDFMEAKGWRAIRMGRAVATFGDRGTVTFGEPGMADWLFLRYPGGDSLWIEFKSPNDRRKCKCPKRCTVCDQEKWKVREQMRGGRVWTVSDYDQFQTWYKNKYRY